MRKFNVYYFMCFQFRQMYFKPSLLEMGFEKFIATTFSDNGIRTVFNDHINKL